MKTITFNASISDPQALGDIEVYCMPARKSADPSTYSGRCTIRLRELREVSGLSVEDIAILVGVKKSAIYNWESGRSEPKLKYFPLLASAYGITNTNDLLPRS